MSTLGGAAIGGVAGGLIAGALGGSPGRGAVMGAGAGALGGALIGDWPQKKGNRERASRPQASRGDPDTPDAKRDDGDTPDAKRDDAGGAGSEASGGDPTRGQFINTTRWTLRVYVNPDPADVDATPSPLVLVPDGREPFDLDVGEHRIVARAHVDTQFGERLVGRYDRTVRIDARRASWFLKFREADFR